MPRCEDYPCCGHAPGECPRLDRHGRPVWTCVACGRRLPRAATSSICARCTRRLQRQWADGGDECPPFDY